MRGDEEAMGDESESGVYILRNSSIQYTIKKLCLNFQNFIFLLCMDGLLNELSPFILDVDGWSEREMYFFLYGSIRTTSRVERALAQKSEWNKFLSKS